MYKYLVIDTVSDESKDSKQCFTHFIALDKDIILDEFMDTVKHLLHFPYQKVIKISFSNDRLTNW